MHRIVLSLLLVFAAALPAHAEEAPPETREPTAEGLVQRGIELRRSGDDEAALAVFLDAEKLAPNSVRILLHVSTAAQASGRWVLAHHYLTKAANYQDTAYYQRYKAEIENVQVAVAQHLGRLRVVGSPSGSEVLISGKSIGFLPLNEPQVLEAGSYQLEVRKAGYFTMRRPITISPGLELSQESVVLNPTTRRLGFASNGAATGASSTSTPDGSATGADDSSEADWLTWTLAGTGVALLATSGAAFILRERRASRWNDDSQCLDRDNPSLSRDELCGSVHREATIAQNVGIVTGVLGVGLSATALGRLIWTGNEENDAMKNRRLASSCRIGLGSVTCNGTF